LPYKAGSVSSRPDVPGENWKAGWEVIRGSEERGPGAEPLVGLRGKATRNGDLGTEPPEAEQVLMIIKTFFWLKFCS